MERIEILSIKAVLEKEIPVLNRLLSPIRHYVEKVKDLACLTFKKAWENSDSISGGLFGGLLMGSLGYLAAKNIPGLSSVPIVESLGTIGFIAGALWAGHNKIIRKVD